MRTRENVIWQDGLLDEKIEEKVCKYLESKHPEYRNLQMGLMYDRRMFVRHNLSIQPGN